MAEKNNLGPEVGGETTEKELPEESSPTKNVTAVASHVHEDKENENSASSSVPAEPRKKASSVLHDWEFFAALLRNKIPHAFVRLAQNSVVAEEQTQLATYFRAVKAHQQENYFLGLPCEGCSLPAVRGDMEGKDENPQTINGNIFINQNVGKTMELFREIFPQRKIVLIVPEKTNVSRLFFTPEQTFRVPNDENFVKAYPFLQDLGKEIAPGMLVLFCCGQIGTILAKDWFQANPAITCLQMDTFFDPLIKGEAKMYHQGIAAFCSKCNARVLSDHELPFEKKALQQCWKVEHYSMENIGRMEQAITEEKSLQKEGENFSPADQKILLQRVCAFYIERGKEEEKAQAKAIVRKFFPEAFLAEENEQKAREAKKKAEKEQKERKEREAKLQKEQAEKLMLQQQVLHLTDVLQKNKAELAEQTERARKALSLNGHNNHAQNEIKNVHHMTRNSFDDLLLTSFFAEDQNDFSSPQQNKRKEIFACLMDCASELPGKSLVKSQAFAKIAVFYPEAGIIPLYHAMLATPPEEAGWKYRLSRRALELRNKPHNFVEYDPKKTINGWKVVAEAALAAFQAGDFQQAMEIHKLLVKEGEYPNSLRAKIEHNGREYAQKLEETKESSLSSLPSSSSLFSSSPASPLPSSETPENSYPRFLASLLPAGEKIIACIDAARKKLGAVGLSMAYTTEIPKIFHFIYIHGGWTFNLMHYLAVATTLHFQKPLAIFLFTNEEPTGNNSGSIWWERAKKLPTVHVIKIVIPTVINRHPVKFLQHQADIIRQGILRKFGGVYQDLDILTLKTFPDEWWDENKVVMCRENAERICNCVIMAPPESPFIKRWLGEYETRYGNPDVDWWGGMSVVAPHQFSLKHPEEILVLPTEAFLPFDYRKENIAPYFAEELDLTASLTKSYTMHLWSTELTKYGLEPRGENYFTFHPRCTFSKLFAEFWLNSPQNPQRGETARSIGSIFPAEILGKHFLWCDNGKDPNGWIEFDKQGLLRTSWMNGNWSFTGGNTQILTCWGGYDHLLVHSPLINGETKEENRYCLLSLRKDGHESCAVLAKPED